jgi:hypothetical protein
MTLNNPTAPVVSPHRGGARTAGYAGSLASRPRHDGPGDREDFFFGEDLMYLCDANLS